MIYTLESNLSIDKNIKKIINNVNYRSEKRRRYQSTDKSKKDENEMIKLLNNKHKLLFKENNINIESKIKDNHEIDDNKNNFLVENTNAISFNPKTDDNNNKIREQKKEFYKIKHKSKMSTLILI